MDMASVTQNTAISIDTAAARIASGFILSGAGMIIKEMNMVKPRKRPIFCLNSILTYSPNK